VETHHGACAAGYARPSLAAVRTPASSSQRVGTWVPVKPVEVVPFETGGDRLHTLEHSVPRKRGAEAQDLTFGQ